MNRDSRQSSRAGGFLIALSVLIGTGIGIALGQPSMGVIGGTGFGVALALLLWLRDRGAS